jgi:diacylglycerol kinase
MRYYPRIPVGRILTFKYAFEGLVAATKSEPNFKIHLTLFAIAVILGLYLGLKSLEWALVFTVAGLVLGLELTNTAIEAVVDGFTDQIHPAAKLAKDIAAGAALVAAMTAGIVAAIIYLPYLRPIFGW